MTEILLPLYETIVGLHEVVLEISGGRRGIRDQKIIHAAVERPRQYISYVDNCDIHTVAAVLLDSVARNHAFIEGNKRTALLTAIYTYRTNGFYLEFGHFMNKDFEDLVLWVVLDKPSIPEIEKRIKKVAEKHKKSGIDKFYESIKRW
jgi:death-on-curing protein